MGGGSASANMRIFRFEYAEQQRVALLDLECEQVDCTQYGYANRVSGMILMSFRGVLTEYAR